MFSSIKSLRLLPLVVSVSLISQALMAQQQTPEQWYQTGASRVLESSRRVPSNEPGAARNIILFLGDGMGISTITAARIFAGQQNGASGEEHRLSFEHFPYTGLARTYNTNQQTPDSAGTMTAIMSGIKTKAGFIGIDAQSQRSNCASYLNSNSPDRMTALELAEAAGMETGIVSTARITHATPAATYAKSPERDWESSSNLPDDAKRLGCTDIARQLIEFATNLQQKVGNASSFIDGIDVIFGGGRRAFFGDDPEILTGFSESPGEGDRDDNRNLIAEWQDSGGQYVMDQSGFDNLRTGTGANILGLFDPSHMHYEADRMLDAGGEPSLADMTQKAIELLENEENGFFLMVEGGRIDHGHHAGNAFNALNETAEFSRAVEAAINATNTEETLIIVTADHSHVMTMAGYPTRGNPILGKVITNDAAGNPEQDYALDDRGMPYTTLGYTNGPGFADYGNETDADTLQLPLPVSGRRNLENVDTTNSGYHQETLVPFLSETHGGEDVAIYASGPGAHLLSGSLEQSVIFHVMNYAGDLENRASVDLED